MTEDDWLDACADAPDDDLRRRAFADWLEERGAAERAEFIRLQVALSRVPANRRDQTQVKRAAELLERHWLEWLGPLADLAPADAWEFPCGLPEALNLSRRRLGAEEVARLVASPYLARITKLRLYENQIGAAGAQALAASPHLDRLTELGLYNNYICNAGAQALAASPHMARLTKLYLHKNAIGDPGAQALAASSHLARLNNLWLGDNHISFGGARALAASPHLARLTELRLGGNRIGAGRNLLRQAFGDRVEC